MLSSHFLKINLHLELHMITSQLVINLHLDTITMSHLFYDVTCEVVFYLETLGEAFIMIDSIK